MEKLQFKCDMCGAIYFLKSNFEKHKEKEIPHFKIRNHTKRIEYEQSRKDYRETVGLGNQAMGRGSALAGTKGKE